MVLGRIDSSGGYDSQGRRTLSHPSLAATVQAWRLDHRLDARRNPRVHVQVKDVSDDGLSGYSEVPVEAGEHISLRFGSGPGRDAYGRVVRCEAGRKGYRVAVVFDPLPAA